MLTLELVLEKFKKPVPCLDRRYLMNLLKAADPSCEFFCCEYEINLKCTATSP